MIVKSRMVSSFGYVSMMEYHLTMKKKTNANKTHSNMKEFLT